MNDMPEKRYMAVFNHERGEFSVHEIANEASARKAFDERREGRRMTFSIFGAKDSSEAVRQADSECGNYHHVADALSE